MANAENTSPTKLNPVQLHLLELFSRNMGEEELADIKKLLSAYYLEKVEGTMNEFWEKEQLTPEEWDRRTKDLHLRRSNDATL